MFELVYSPTKYQRVYKFDNLLNYIPRPNFTAKEYWDCISEKYKIKTINTNILEFVCISDAITHIERLVFPVTKCNETGEWIMTFDDIAGNHGWITGLGKTKIYNDEVYLRYLIMYNNKQIKLKGE